MAQVTLEQRFQGMQRLMTVHLWRVGQTTDLKACLDRAQELSMIDGDDRAFMERCLELDGPWEALVDQGLLDAMQCCVHRINTADPA